MTGGCKTNLAAQGAFTNGSSKLRLHNIFLAIVICDPSCVMLEAVDKILSSSMVDPEVEAASVSISLFE